PDSNAHALARNLECGRPQTSTSVLSRLRPDADAGVFLQRDLFYVCARLDAVLRRARTECWSVSAAVCGREPARADRAGTFFRNDRPQKDDRHDLWCFRNLARAGRVAFSCGTVDCSNTDAGVDDH